MVPVCPKCKRAFREEEWDPRADAFSCPVCGGVYPFEVLAQNERRKIASDLAGPGFHPNRQNQLVPDPEEELTLP